MNGNNSSQIAKRKIPICTWAKISFGLVLAALILLGIGYLFNEHKKYHIADVFFGLNVLSFFLAFFTGLIAVFEITKSKGTFRGELPAYIGIFTGLLLLLLSEFGPYMGPGQPDRDDIHWTVRMMRKGIEPKPSAEAKQRHLHILQAALAAGSLAGWLLLPTARLKIFGLLVAAAAALAGAYMAWESEKLYLFYSRIQAAPIGIQIGLFWGAFTGIGYSFVIGCLCRTSRLIPWGTNRLRARFDLLLAMAAGLLCSAAVHLTLAAHHEAYIWAGALLGACFGLLAGLLVGALVRMLFCLTVIQKSSQRPETADTI